jgi:hypothetical protein
MEVEIKRLPEDSPTDPRRHPDQDRVRRYTEDLHPDDCNAILSERTPLLCL